MSSLIEAWSEDALRRAAGEALANAQALHSEAQLLVEHDHAARAVALALIGREEFAKAIVYTIAAVRPDDRAHLKMKLDHAPKHRVAASVEGALIVFDEFAYIDFENAGYGPSAEDRLIGVLADLGGSGLGGLLPSRQEARAYYSNLEREVPGTLSSVHRREAALYVDLTPAGEVLTPARVVSHADADVDTLQYYLDEFRLLPELLQQEDLWSRFAARVR